MHRLLIATCLALLTLTATPASASDPVRAIVRDPYLDLHTGPGRGYPITYSVPRGTRVELLRSRTDWVKVRAGHGHEGWAHRAQVARMLDVEVLSVDPGAGPPPQARTTALPQAVVGIAHRPGFRVAQAPREQEFPMHLVPALRDVNEETIEWTSGFTHSS
ncbi:MAG TPA: SH3 domain-containing protein [Steroidobacteraceae bacterium]|nr:SH3 domain-containing protein [Steroidobacteraceae bacterium]